MLVKKAMKNKSWTLIGIALIALDLKDAMKAVVAANNAIMIEIIESTEDTDHIMPAIAEANKLKHVADAIYRKFIAACNDTIAA